MGWGVGVGEVFTHLWDKHTSQGHEELIPVHWRTANFHCNTKPASCGRGPQKIQIWDSMKGDYSIPKLGLNCKMRCICDLGCCLIPIPLLTWASCPFIFQYRLSLDWIVQRLPHSKFPSREWLSRMCLSRASHCSPASLARPQSHVLQKEIPGSLPWVPCRTYGRVCSTRHKVVAAVCL